MDADRAAAKEQAGRQSDAVRDFPSPELVAFVRAWEGCCLNPYQDVAGLWTVGVGHLLHVNDPLVPVTQDEADSLLAVDLLHTRDAVDDLVRVPLTPPQRDALCSFTFNLGAGALADSTMLRLVNLGQYEAAAYEFPKWAKARVNGALQMVAGLMKRRAAEREMWTNGDYSGRP